MKPETSRCLRDITKLVEFSDCAISKHSAAAIVHCDLRTAERILAHLWLNKMTRITSWEKVYNNTTPRYRLGAGIDRPRPKPLTAAEKKRKHRARPGVREKEAFDKRMRRSVGKEVRLGMFGI